jgi:hypothetical protein
MDGMHIAQPKKKYVYPRQIPTCAQAKTAKHFDKQGFLMYN